MCEENENNIKSHIELEEKLKDYNKLARIYYKETRFIEAKKLWQKIIKEGAPLEKGYTYDPKKLLEQAEKNLKKVDKKLEKRRKIERRGWEKEKRKEVEEIS